MFECEIWIDIECKLDEQTEVVCSVFARHSFANRPLMGETLSFHAVKGAKPGFNLTMAWGSMPSSHVSTEVHEVGHHRGSLLENHQYKTSLRCAPVRVQAIADARAVVDFLSMEHGFEIDPYGLNKLHGGGSAA